LQLNATARKNTMSLAFIMKFFSIVKFINKKYVEHKVNNSKPPYPFKKLFSGTMFTILLSQLISGNPK